MDVTTALNMATLVHSGRPKVEDTCVSFYQGSDFIMDGFKNAETAENKIRTILDEYDLSKEIIKE